MAIEPPATIDARAYGPPLGRLAAELARWTAPCLATTMLLAAAILAWRRLAGPFLHPNPLGMLPLLGTSLVVATLALVGRTAWRFGRMPLRAGVTDRLVGLLFSAAVLTTGAALSPALSLSGTPFGGLVVLWVVLAGEEAWAWCPGRWRRILPWMRTAASAAAARSADRSTLIPASPSLHAFHPALPRELTAGRPPDTHVTQQFTRLHQADGGEVLAGWLRVSLAAGQRTANVHVAFCPPFAHVPRAEIRQTEGPKTRIKTVQVLPFGARFDLKLADVGETESTVLLQFSAEASRPAVTTNQPPVADS